MTNKIRGDFLIENFKDENSSNDFTLRSGTAEGVVPFYLRSHRGPGTIREPQASATPTPFHETLAAIATPRLSYRFADGTNHGSYGSGGDITIDSSGNKATFVSDSVTYPGFIGYFNIPDLSAQSSGVRNGAHQAKTATASSLSFQYGRGTSSSPAARSWIVVWYQASALASGKRVFQGQSTAGGAGRLSSTTNSFNSAINSIDSGTELLAAIATGSVGSAETLSNTSEKLCIVMDTWDGSDLITYWKQTGHGAGHTKLLRAGAGTTATHLSNAWQAAGASSYVAYPIQTLHSSVVNATLTPANFDTLCAAAGL